MPFNSLVPTLGNSKMYHKPLRFLIMFSVKGDNWLSLTKRSYSKCQLEPFIT